jgi:hypothetical protein
MVDPRHLQFDPCTTLWAIFWRFRVPVAQLAILLALQEVPNAFADEAKLATTVCSQEKPQQNEDDYLFDKSYIKGNHDFFVNHRTI